MKKIVLAAMMFGAFCLLNSVYSQTVIYDSEIKGTLTKAASPYILFRDVIVPLGDTLIIEPGAHLQFATFAGLTVEGSLSAVGTDAEKICFTSADTTEVKTDCTKGWDGITIRGTLKDTIRMENCIIHYVFSNQAQFTYETKGALSVYNRYAIISKCTISKCFGYSNGGIYWADEADGIIRNCIIRDNISDHYGGINIYRSGALLINNLIADNGTGLMIRSTNTANDTVKVYNNTIVESRVKTRWMEKIVGVEHGLADFQNTIITGVPGPYSPQIIDIYNSDHTSFKNCIIKDKYNSVELYNSVVSYDEVIYMEPVFADTASYFSAGNSCAVNSGNDLPAAIMALFPSDLAGNPRIYDGTVDRIDIGAYEYQGDVTANRPPCIIRPGTKYLFVSSSAEMNFTFQDPDESDTHTLSVTTDNPNIHLGALTSQTNNATYTVSPLTGWSGMARIILSVADHNGALDTDTFSVVVSDTVNYSITENTTWDKDTVYIGSSFQVAANATLEIHPGTCVLFKGNYSVTIAGIIHANGTAAEKIRFTVSDTTGYWNKTHSGWGGIILANNREKSVFDHCIFEFAKDKSAVEMYEASEAGFVNCIFRNNGSRKFYPGNKAIIEGDKVKLYVGNCLFYDNESTYATIYMIHSDLVVCNSNFFRNAMTLAVVSNNYGGNTLIKNSIFWSNVLRDNTIEASSQDHCEISNCILDERNSKILTTGLSVNKENIYYGDPQFADTLNSDFHLLSSSPCIDKGIADASLAGLGNVDMDGNDRIYDAFLPDIGAYEYQGIPTNRKPEIEKTEDKTAMLGLAVTGKVNFYDADESDTHTITVISHNPQVTIQDLSGDTTGSVYSLVAASGYSGDAVVSVVVEDNGGLRDSIFYTLHVVTSACGAIEEDITWDRDTVDVTCDVTVKAGAILTITAGTKVIFHGPYSLTVNGALKALGNMNDSILFTAPDSIWTGIKLNPESGQDTSVLQYCEIRYSKAGGLNIQNSYKNAIRVSGCFIHHNCNTGIGGGICMYGESISIENCIISHNTTDRMGGGIYTDGMGSRIANNVISDNQSLQGGNGIYSSASSNTGSVIEGNLLENNLSINSNEAIYSTCDTIRNNIIRSNGGGGIRGYLCSYISNNLIENNGRSGIHLNNGSFKVLNNVIMLNNRGIFLYKAGGLVANNTICKNRGNGKGSGIEIQIDSAAVLMNNIIYGNGSPLAESQVNVTQMPVPVRIYHCLIEGGKEGISFESDIPYVNPCDKIIGLNPYFRDFANNDFTLSDSSVCIDAGSPDTAGMNLPLYDYAGNPRIYDGTTDRIDIGAIEFAGDPVNRPPVLYEMSDIHMLISQTRKLSVDFLDTDAGDTHTLSVESDTPEMKVQNLSGDVSGSAYDLVPETGWKGSSTVTVKVTDSRGFSDSCLYTVEVSNNVCGELTENTTWDADTIFVTCNVKVPEGIMLTIMPNTVVAGYPSGQIDVYGTLNAVGDDSDSIKFTSVNGSTIHPNNYWKNIHFYNNTASQEPSKLIRCMFEYSQHMVVITDKVYISKCHFKNCSSSVGGALDIHHSNPIVELSVFEQNRALYNGGALAVEGIDYSYDMMPTIRYNLFFSNTADIGGAIYASDINPVISHNYFYDNNAINGGAMFFAGCNTFDLTNNLIYRNNASQSGGAISFSEAVGKMMNNTIVMNNADVHGGAIYMGRYSRVINTNNIFYYNKIKGMPGQIYFNPEAFYLALYNCILQGGEEGIRSTEPVENDIVCLNTFDANPFFADTLYNDYKVTDSSYCINAGRLVTDLPVVDLNGNQRIYPGLLANVDIGAYEFQGFPANRKPLIEFTPDQYTDIATSKTVGVIFSDVDKTDTHTITILSGDGNVTVENLSGHTSGSTYDLVPAANWSGSAEITVKVEDNRGGYVIDTFSLFVADNHPPVVAIPLSDTAACIGENFTYAIPANSFTDADPGDTLIYSAALTGNGQLPAWLAFHDQTLTFSGIPGDTDIGTMAMVVTVTDKYNNAVNDTFQLTVNQGSATEEFGCDLFRVYPVPTRESVNIIFQDNGRYDEITVTLYDLYGKLIEARITKDERLIKIDLGPLPAGIYYLKVRADNEVKTFKIIKE
ncbi:MAG: right-handed parallel beta-helix repeat-containing protein [Bacteroidales bacterium]|nr:right-handed parallel beta-helix repeat-containing protein [Bacteroidales bacterium]